MEITTPVKPASAIHPANEVVSVLLVDDEVRNLDVLESILAAPGLKLVRALTADAALLMLINGEFACIVLDVHMPGMSGIELAQLVKTRKRSEHVPIIFLTAYFQDEADVLKGYGVGAVDYLTKPLNPDILKSKVTVFVNLYRATHALAASNAALEHEITQRQNAEAALRQANQELEQRVQERTTDLSRANVELRQSEERYRLILEYAIFTIDLNGLVTTWNAGAQRIVGFAEAEIIGRRLDIIFTPEDREKGQLDVEMGRALTNDRAPDERWHLRKDGSPFWAAGLMMPLKDDAGRHHGFLKILRDQTARKRAEEALSRAKDELEARVVERTAELEKVNVSLHGQIHEREQLELLVLGISEREQQRIGQDLHDGLCQHLTGIKFRAKLLEEKLAKRGVPETAEARTLESLLNQAIDQARSQARGLYPVRLQADGLIAALQELAAHISSVFNVECEVTTKEPVDIHDHTRAIHLFRITQEAISNAIRHGKASQIKLKLAQQDGEIELAVHDNGLGLPTRPKYNTGTGLHIMNYRAHSIGGRLEIRSNEPRGTVVVCLLPSQLADVPKSE